MAAKSLQSCLTLYDPIDGSPSGSPVPGILQARTLEWLAIAFSNAWKWKVKVKSLSRVLLLATPWTAAFQAPPFMGFSRPEYWSWVPLPKAKKPTWCVSSERVTTVGNWDSVSLGTLWKATEKTCLRHDSPRVKKSKILILQLPSLSDEAWPPGMATVVPLQSPCGQAVQAPYHWEEPSSTEDEGCKLLRWQLGCTGTVYPSCKGTQRLASGIRQGALVMWATGK